MKKTVIILIVLMVCFLNAYSQQESILKYDSIWEGKLNINANISLKVILKTIKKDDGTLSGFLDSPDQGAKDIPASSISLTSDSLKFEIKAIGASYEGVIIKDSMLAKGTFKQGSGNLELTLKKVEKIVEAKRPQIPEKPYPYNEEEITFTNKTANIELTGTITFPKTNGKYPAVVLVTGSGRQDRDETLFNHKPFLVIADYLTRNGIVVLRYDDRGVAKSKGNFAGATTLDFTTDALSAVEYLKTRKEVDQNKIGIIGHSEGGIIAPLAAVESSDVNFIILLAGPGMSGKDLIPLQSKLLMQAQGSSQAEIEKNVNQLKKVFEIIDTAPDSAAAVKTLDALYETESAKLSDEEKAKPENSKEAFEQIKGQFMGTWFRFFLKHEPKNVLENVQVPVLALLGSKDLQVPSKENIPLIKEALDKSGNKNYKILELENLNHLFQTASTGSVLEYGQIEETFSPKAAN